MSIYSKCKSSLLLAMLGTSGPALSAPGVLSDIPLSLGTPVQPNVLFLLDDSGSMDWSFLTSTEGRAAYGYFDIRIDFTPNPSNFFAELFFLNTCSAYNVMYYNPSKKYTPWVGVDRDGNPYTDQPINAARVNPFNPGTGTTNLAALASGDPYGYFPWTDSNGNKLFDAGECGENSDLSVYYRNFIPVSAMDAEEKTNFANWYSYYRTRDYVMKRALSEIISNNRYRSGLATLHNRSSVGTIIKDIDDITLPTDSTAQQNKLALMRNLFRVRPGNGTPLRQNLEDAGQYFQEGVNPGNSLFGFRPAHDNKHQSSLSPILNAANGGTCQQNFTVLLTDGFWNGNNPSSSIGNADGDNNTDYDGDSYADTFSRTLADVAMRYYERDLSPSLADKIPTTNIDTNPAQHMVTYTVAFGVSGSVTANPTDRNAPFSWPRVTTNTQSTIDDVRHAAWNGRGEFLSAKDPEELIESLGAAINGIQDRVGSASAVSLTSGTISTSTLVFQAIYNSQDWTGDIIAYGFDSNNKLNATPVWKASEKVESQLDSIGHNSRNIMTFNGDLGTVFKFPSDYQSLTPDIAPYTLESTQVADLLTNAPFDFTTTNPAEIAANQAYGDRLTNYLRGDKSSEGAGTSADGTPLFRERNGKYLGDIINSDPIFVGAPRASYPDNIEGTEDEKRYSTFAIDNKTRQGVVYVGANDGMLHAFQSDTGQELFTYIPQLMFSSGPDRGLSKLSEQDYGHLSYTDGAVSVTDIFVNNPNVGGSDKWRSYLVGALRAGGKGIYVLDVTDPSTFVANPTSINDGNLRNLAKSMVVGEFTHPDLGYTYSKPQVAKLKNGRWAAIFGNGYNNDPTGDGKAKLFIVYLDDLSFNILDTNVGSMVGSDCLNTASDCNGLSSPTLVDINSDSIIDYVYAGDLHGNMWRFNLNTTDPNYSSVAGVGNDKIKHLFQACNDNICTATNRQPITTKPSIRSHPHRRAIETKPNVLVFFGTGQFLAVNDNFNTEQRSFYGIWDNGKSSYTRSRLQEQVITEGVQGTFSIRTLSNEPVNYQPSDLTGTAAEWGWFIDLPKAGERVYLDSLLFGDNIFFISTTPNTNQCGSGGQSFLMAADYLTGGSPKAEVFLDVDDETDPLILAGYQTDLSSAAAITDDGQLFRSIGSELTSTSIKGTDFGRSRRKTWSVRK